MYLVHLVMVYSTARTPREGVPQSVFPLSLVAWCVLLQSMSGSQHMEFELRLFSGSDSLFHGTLNYFYISSRTTTTSTLLPMSPMMECAFTLMIHERESSFHIHHHES